MKRITIISGLLAALFLTFSCGGNPSPKGEAGRCLVFLDSLVEADADSALRLMGRTESREWSQRDAMRLELLRAKAMNRADSTFTTDSLMLQVADYYQRKGSPNDRMLSLYLLGCTYRDMGTAPRAVETWQKAVDEADTTRADCDLSTLMRIHSQMAELYNRQRLYDYMQKEDSIAATLCWRMGDTLSALLFEREVCNTLFIKGEYKACIHKADSLYSEYLQMELKDEAALVSVYCVKSYLGLEEYAKAREYLEIYESYCLSEKDHRKIDGGLAPYYIYKGRYYLGIGNVDSAEYCFRKAKHVVKRENNLLLIYKGLIRIYGMYNKMDSVMKYMLLYSDTKEKVYYSSTAQATINAKALYDYSVEQRIAKEAEAQKIHWRINFLSLAVMALAVIGLIVLLWMRQHYRKERELSRKELELSRKEAQSKALQAELTATRQNLEVTAREQAELIGKKEELEERLRRLSNSLDNEKETTDTLARELESVKTDIQAKAQTIELQNLLIKNLEQAIGTMDHNNRMEKLRKYPVLAQIRQYLNSPKASSFPNAYWQKLATIVEEGFPTFYSVTHANGAISEDEYRICLLTKAGFSVSEMNILMGKTEYASNTKKRLLKKIFGIEGKPAEFDLHIDAII